MTVLLNDEALAECPCCQRLVPAVEVQTRRMNTQYAKHDDNFMTSCLLCFEISEENWADLWAEYHAGKF